MKPNKPNRINYSLFAAVLGLGFCSQNAMAVNITVTKGWPCNVFLRHPGVVDAVGNFVDFNVKATPASGTSAYSFVAGDSVDYLTTLGLTFNSLVANLPLLEPLSFNLKSENFGAKLGVDVCIPPVNVARDEVLDWDVKAFGLGALMPPAEGDWFSQSNPKISMELLASNCNGSVSTPMSTATPTKAGSCYISSTPLPGSDSLSAGGIPVDFGFRLMASRQAVLRFTVEERNLTRRRQLWDAGVIQIELEDPPLPPVLVGDLLGKQLFFAADTDLIAWPGCKNFKIKSGIAFDNMNLQGPNSSLDLRWTGKDTDCNTSGTCADGNKRTNNFSFPVLVYLEDGSLAPPSASPTAKVKSFIGLYDDQVASGENVYPSAGKIAFDATLDEVYRDSTKAFFSTTVSRLVAANQWRECRVWFKRDNGFDCDTLPTSKLRNICEDED